MDLLTTFGFILAANFVPWFVTLHALNTICVLTFLWFCFSMLPYKVRHTIRSGICWFGIPCNSWIFMTLGFNFECVRIHGFLRHISFNPALDQACMIRSQGSTRRHMLRPAGWSHLKSTGKGNRLARRLCYLFYSQSCTTWESVYKASTWEQSLPMVVYSKWSVHSICSTEGWSWHFGRRSSTSSNNPRLLSYFNISLFETCCDDTKHVGCSVHWVPTMLQP